MNDIFYEHGLRFGCTQCGKCCTGEPGRVEISRQEIDRLASHLRLSPSEFEKRFTRIDGKQVLLTEKANGDCIFFDQGCTVYAARPLQCRLYPFWFRNLRNASAWVDAAKQCPGIGAGRLYSKDEIIALVGQDIENRRGHD